MSLRLDSLWPQEGTKSRKKSEKDSSKRFRDWAEIEAFLESGETTASSSSSLIEKMLQSRLQQDSATQAAEAEERRQKDAIALFCKLVLSQAEQTIVSPLKSLVAEFNQQYAGNKASISVDIPASLATQAFTFAVEFPSGHTVMGLFRVLLDRDFVREVPADFRYRVPRREICIPHIKNRRVQGWGIVKGSDGRGSDGRGFNVLLVEKPDEVYGEFVMLQNEMGFPANVEQRPSPFAFDFQELEAELQLIGAAHIYSTKVLPLDVNYLRGFAAQYA